MLTQPQKDFVTSLCKLTADGASYIPGEPQEITEFVITELQKAFEEQTEKAGLNELIDDAEQVILTGCVAFGSENAQTLGKNLVEALNDAQAGKFVEVALLDIVPIINSIKKVAKENKAKK